MSQQQCYPSSVTTAVVPQQCPPQQCYPRSVYHSIITPAVSTTADLPNQKCPPQQCYSRIAERWDPEIRWSQKIINIQYTVYSIQYTVYSIQYTVYSLKYWGGDWLICILYYGDFEISGDCPQFRFFGVMYNKEMYSNVQVVVTLVS